MTLFHGIYKCRLCGELFESITTASENTAIESVSGAAYAGKWYPKGCGIGAHVRDVHHCKDGSWGIGDFQEFKKEEDK